MTARSIDGTAIAAGFRSVDAYVEDLEAGVLTAVANF